MGLALHHTAQGLLEQQGRRARAFFGKSTAGPISRLIADMYLQKFDSVVVASGHYHSPRIPDIPGLKEWKQRWPSRVWHSKSYRKPDEFRGKVSLIYGSHVYSID